MSCRNAVYVLCALVFAVVLCLLPVALLAQDQDDYPLPAPPNAAGSFTPADEPIRFIGNYCAGFGGASLAETQPQTFTVDVEGDPVAAYILWSGRNRTAAGVDPTIFVSGSDGISGTITATIGLEVESQDKNGRLKLYWLTQVYSDVIEEGFPIINTGENTFTVSGLNFQERHGAGAIILSEGRERCPFQAINLFYGDDVLYYNWPSPWGPHSDVSCVTFPSPPEDVEIDIQMFVGGVENEKRANAIWYATGSGALPDNLVGNTDLAANIIMPLRGLNGHEFDNYDTLVQNPDQRIIATPGDTWACVQIESPKCAVRSRECPTPDPRFGDVEAVEKGISANWINLVTRVPLFDIDITPDGMRQLGESHTFTVTVDASFGMTTSSTLVITPSVEPGPTSMSDTCDTPIITEKSASCTVTINSTVADVYTATAAAEIGFEDKTAFAFTNSVGESSGPAAVTYVGVPLPVPAIDIEKATNGEDADLPPGPSLTVGEVVTWTYAVTNTGGVTLSAVAVTDDKLGSIPCPQTVLTPTKTMVCTMTGHVLPGQYVNEAEAVGIAPDGTAVSDLDRSAYIGGSPQSVAIHVEKATNGQDADQPPGPTLIVGEIVTWTYQVTNIGTLLLSDVSVNDDQIGDIPCPKTTLASQKTMFCMATGLVEPGQYVNVATATGTGSNGTLAIHKDSSAYLGVEPPPPGGNLFLPAITHNLTPPKLQIIKFEVDSDHTRYEDDMDVLVTEWKRDLTGVECQNGNLARCLPQDVTSSRESSQEDLELAPNRVISIVVAVDRTDVDLVNPPPVIFELTHGEWIAYGDGNESVCSSNPTFANGAQGDGLGSPGMRYQQTLPVTLDENGQATFTATYQSCSRISLAQRQNRQRLQASCEHVYGDFRKEHEQEPEPPWDQFFPWDTLVVWLDLNGDGEPDASDPSCGLMIP